MIDQDDLNVPKAEARLIYILTVHWQTPFWIPLQRKYLARFMKKPFKMFAFLTGIDRDYSRYFDYACFEEIADHATKLNILADMVSFCAQENDLLIFLDGDAFPINDLNDDFFQKVKNHELAAIQRIENNGDVQPHPSFCATSVGFWKEIKGNWHGGFYWKDNQGDLITDVGGELLKILDENHIDWHRMLRTNRKNLHPLAFGIYDNLVYHHAIGFRKGYGGRIALAQAGEKEVLKRLDVRVLNRLFPKRWPIHIINPYYRKRKRLRKEFQKVNLEMLNNILNEEDFYKRLL